MLVRETVPTRRIVSHNFFASLYQRLAETSLFQRSGRERERIARTPVIEQIVLQQVHETESTSTRNLAHSSGFPFQRLEHFPRTRHASISHELSPGTAIDNYVPRIAFAQ